MINLEIIRKFEGCSLKAYNDPATGGKPITIGWGSTFYEDGSKVKIGDKITQERADNLLRIEATRLLGLIKTEVPNLSQKRLDSLVSFAYNLGIGNLKSSTLLRKIKLNPEDRTIYDEFLRWNKAGGVVLNGLTRRRTEEAENYFSK